MRGFLICITCCSEQLDALVQSLVMPMLLLWLHGCMEDILPLLN
jgi:hypothetical protein